jgi:hypothetical protein
MNSIKTLRMISLALVLTACSRATSTENSSLATGTGTIRVTGHVADNNGTPIANARVYIPGADAATRTDANGNYALNGVPDGPQEVVVRSRGYAPTRVDAKFSTKRSDRDRNHVDVTLLTPSQAVAVANQQQRDSIGLARNGFLQRQQLVRGAYFLTPEEIAGTRATTTSDLFRQVPLLTEVPGPTGPVLRGATGCLNTYVDGLRWRTMFPGDLDTYIPVNDVVAAEVYPPGTVPPAPFARGSGRLNCTTLAIWTRSSVG